MYRGISGLSPGKNCKRTLSRCSPGHAKIRVKSPHAGSRRSFSAFAPAPVDLLDTRPAQDSELCEPILGISYAPILSSTQAGSAAFWPAPLRSPRQYFMATTELKQFSHGLSSFTSDASRRPRQPAFGFLPSRSPTLLSLLLADRTRIAAASHQNCVMIAPKPA